MFRFVTKNIVNIDVFFKSLNNFASAFQKSSGKFWGFPKIIQNYFKFGDGEILGIGIQGFLGAVPEIPQNSGKGIDEQLLSTLGTYWGRGESNYWGILRINSSKILECWVGDGDKIFGEFAKSSTHQ